MSLEEFQSLINGLRYVADAEDRRRPFGGLSFRQRAEEMERQIVSEPGALIDAKKEHEAYVRWLAALPPIIVPPGV